MTTANRLIEQVKTTELRVGDIVWTHGGRFVLTECLIDAERADFLARASVSYEHAQSDGADALARYMDRETNLRSFKGTYLGPSHDGIECEIPEHWRKGWNVQGNHLAHWIVELPRGDGKARTNDPADLYVRGVEFVALNDDPGVLDAKQVETTISVSVVSEVFEVPAKQVARDVVGVRKALKKDTKQARALPDHRPTVGEGVTQVVGSDRYPFTVTRVHETGLRCWVKADEFKRTDKNGISESQSYEFTPNPDAVEIELRWNGVRWASRPASRRTYRIGVREAYLDPSF
jgi:hypothetical protein